MKKSLIALLLVAMIVVLPCIAMAQTVVPYANNTTPSDALDPHDSAWLYYKEAVTIKTETEAPAADVVIPASGVASFAVIASVVATLGCAVLPKK